MTPPHARVSMHNTRQNSPATVGTGPQWCRRYTTNTVNEIHRIRTVVFLRGVSLAHLHEHTHPTGRLLRNILTWLSSPTLASIAGPRKVQTQLSPPISVADSREVPKKVVVVPDPRLAAAHLLVPLLVVAPSHGVVLKLTPGIMNALRGKGLQSHNHGTLTSTIRYNSCWPLKPKSWKA